jgi:rhodanese-related sulfurtransferase
MMEGLIQKRLWASAAAIITLVSLLVALPLLGACGEEEPALVMEPPPTPALPSEPAGFDAVHAAVSQYLTSGSSWNIKTEDLFLLLNDDDKNNDPFIISVRKAEDYAKGHIPSAVNISFGDIAKNGTLNALPKDKKIVVYCYTGHSGSQATAILGTLGFDVLNLLHGMSSWTKDTEVAPNRFTPEKRQDFAFETTPNQASETYPLPTMDKTVRGAAQAYSKTKNISSEDLFLLLNDDDAGNDPFIISVRKPEDYAKGHIPGAVNIGFTALAEKDTLATIPPDRPIVVYCYTGHTGSQATALLNLLGYDATNLLFGMCSWTQNTEVAPKCFDNETASMDYDFELTPNVFVPKEEPVTPTEEEPLPAEAVVMAGDTCVACHTSQALLEKLAEPEEEKSEATSGEG